MGSGASSSPVPSPEPPPSKSNPPGKPTGYADPQLKTTLVRTNEVAPIVIKNCKEEYQCVWDFKDPIVYDRIAPNLPEHPLLQNQYFLVKDVLESIDKLGTHDEWKAPNVRRCEGGFPVPIYGMGQPTREGLHGILEKLLVEGYSNVMVFNLRQEPVLFVKDGYDMIPYSPRLKDQLKKCLIGSGKVVEEVDELERTMRKEVLKLAKLKDEEIFYFYNDIEHFRDDPHKFRVAFEDDLSTSEEIYNRPCFFKPGLSYLHLCVAEDSAPTEEEFDAFVNAFRSNASFFSDHDVMLPALVFTCHSGIGRCNLGMVMGCLMLSHKIGFPQEALKNPYPINEKSPNYERGEYLIIQQLVKYLTNGLQIKQEVDVLIDLCGELCNLRTKIFQYKTHLESLSEDNNIQAENGKDIYLSKCKNSLTCYFYLICFNAYLHDQFPLMFATSFSKWMQSQPHLYRMLMTVDMSRQYAPVDLVSNKTKLYLVADDFIGLDVLSSYYDVKVSNFRRVLGFPIYGMAQPSREGLSCLVNYLTSKKQGHPCVVLVNLRQDFAIEGNGTSYSPREMSHLDEPLVMLGLTAKQIEDKEEQLKVQVKTKKSLEVYQELDKNREMREFTSVLTPRDMYEQQKLQTPNVIYHRVPMSDDCAPNEQDFDNIVSLMNEVNEIFTDEDGPALVFQCRTGKGRTTTAMAIGGLIYCHKKGFPYGTKPGEQDRVSLPNAHYTLGNYRIVEQLIRLIPNGQQIKREVDFILDQCSETMTPMHYHAREIIFVTYNKMKKAKSEEERQALKNRSLDYLERYIYLIIFNTYLHSERQNSSERSFSVWMKEVGSKAGLFDIIDNLAFTDFETEREKMRTRRARYMQQRGKIAFRGAFI